MRDSFQEGIDCPHAAAAVQPLMGKNRTRFGGLWRVCSVLARAVWVVTLHFQRCRFAQHDFVWLFLCHLSLGALLRRDPPSPSPVSVLPAALHPDIQAAGRNTVVNLCLLNALVWPWAPAAQQPLSSSPAQPLSFLLYQLSGESVWASLWCTIIRTQVWFKVISMNLSRKRFKLTGALTLLTHSEAFVEI